MMHSSHSSLRSFFIIFIVILGVNIVNSKSKVSALEKILVKEDLQDEERALIKSLTVTLKSKNGLSHTSSSSLASNLQGDNSMLIMENGEIDTRWSSKCGKSLLMRKLCSPYMFDIYTDEASFEFSYTNASQTMSSLYSVIKPTVRASQGRAQPEVNDFSYDEEANVGEVIIWHNCKPHHRLSRKRPSEELSVISLSLSINSRIAVRIRWKKVCGGGHHQRLDYGYFADRPLENEGLIPVSLKYPKTNDPLLFGPRILSTRLYLSLREGAYSQQFTDASVDVEEIVEEDESDHDNSTLKIKMNNQKKIRELNNDGEPASIELRGPIGGGILKPDVETAFDIIYLCTGPGFWYIKFSVLIPPFEKIQMQWRKDCGGGIEKNIEVSNYPKPRHGDIVRAGVVRPIYSQQGTRDKSRKSGAFWGHGRGNRVFFLLVDGSPSKSGEGGIAIGEIVANSEDERIGLARVHDSTDSTQYYYDHVLKSRTRMAGFKSIPENGEVVTKRVRRAVRVRVDCLKRGWMRVAVRISVRDRQPVEWWFWNECSLRRGYKNRGFAKAMWETGFVMFLFFATLFILMRRSSLPANKSTVLHSRYRGLANHFRIVYPDNPRSL